jgi:hypothetical protein
MSDAFDINPVTGRIAYALVQWRGKWERADVLECAPRGESPDMWFGGKVILPPGPDGLMYFFFARSVNRSNTRFVATTDDPIGYWRTDGLDAVGTNLWGGGVAPIRVRQG